MKTRAPRKGKACIVCRTEEDVSACHGCQKVHFCEAHASDEPLPADADLHNEDVILELFLHFERHTHHTFTEDDYFRFFSVIDITVRDLDPSFRRRLCKRLIFGVVDSYLSTLNRSTIHKALSTSLATLLFEEYDTLPCQMMVPALMVWLDMDCEAYGFIRQWHNDRGHMRLDLSMPFFNMGPLNILENPRSLKRQPWHTGHLSVLLYIKYKIFDDVHRLSRRSANNVEELHGTTGKWQEFHPRSSIVAQDSAFREVEDYGPVMRTLLKQMAWLILRINKHNRDFWFLMFLPEHDAIARFQQFLEEGLPNWAVHSLRVMYYIFLSAPRTHTLARKVLDKHAPKALDKHAPS